MFWGCSLHPSCPLSRPEILQWPGVLEHSTHSTSSFKKRSLDQSSLGAVASDGIQGFTCHLSLNIFVSLHRSYKLKSPFPDFDTNKFIFWMHLLSIQKKWHKEAWPCTSVHPVYKIECFKLLFPILWQNKDVFLISVTYCIFTSQIFCVKGIFQAWISSVLFVPPLHTYFIPLLYMEFSSPSSKRRG